MPADFHITDDDYANDAESAERHSVRERERDRECEECTSRMWSEEGSTCGRDYLGDFIFIMYLVAACGGALGRSGDMGNMVPERANGTDLVCFIRAGRRRRRRILC